MHTFLLQGYLGEKSVNDPIEFSNLNTLISITVQNTGQYTPEVYGELRKTIALFIASIGGRQMISPKDCRRDEDPILAVFEIPRSMQQTVSYFVSNEIDIEGSTQLQVNHIPALKK